MKEQGERVEGHDRHEQEAVADEHAEVLEHAAHHGPEKIGGEADVGRLRVAEGVGEDQVGDEDRGEAEHARDYVAEDTTGEHRTGRSPVKKPGGVDERSASDESQCSCG